LLFENSYQKYLNAVSNNTSKDEIKIALDEYQLNYKIYLEALGNKEETSLTRVVDSSTTSSFVKTSSSSGITSAQDPVYKKNLSPELYSQKNKLAKILSNLENSLKTAKDPNTIARLKLEIAFIYEEFKQDKLHAKELLDEIMTMAGKGLIDEKIYQQAREELRKVNARLDVDTHLDDVFQKKEAAYAAQRKYDSYSFFKNPISKTFSLFSKWSKSTKYTYSIAKMRKVKYDYEAKGEYNINSNHMTFMLNAIKFDLTCSDVFEAIDMTRPAPTADVTLITTNMTAWYARWQMLENARDSIDLTYFIVEKDIFGMSLMGMLLKKAKEGVKIRFMVDARGSGDISKSFTGQDYLQELVQYPNVEVKIYNPNLEALTRIFSSIRNMVTSNHDKIIIIDNEWCITGGRNISLNYFVDPKDNNMVFRDTDILMHSPLVCQQLGLAFDEEFNGLKNNGIEKDLFANLISRDDELTWAYKAMDRYIKGQGLYGDENKYLAEYNYELTSYPSLVNYNSYDSSKGSLRVAIEILDKHSFVSERNDITVNIVRFISAAKDEIIIQNPYVIITDTIYQALVEASKRGVKIIVHTNSPISTDSILTQAFFIEDWIKFLKEIKTLRIYAFIGESKLHAKTFCFDKQVSVIGTYNMDYMSEQLNSEVVATVNSDRFASLHRGLIMRDIGISTEYKISVDGSGNVTVINGPRNVSPKKTMLIIDILRKFKFLKPLI
jgi:phosphatidylserine/phosphatidylglycerophosphate/cardiolipin synthase-like enzyme